MLKDDVKRLSENHPEIFDLEMYKSPAFWFQLPGTNCCDSGIIESEIIKVMSPNMKSAFRTFKFLIHQIIVDRNIESDFKLFMEEEKILKLFGYKSDIKSYHLRIIFLHFIIQSYGSGIWCHLENNPGLVVVCLLDMLLTVISCYDYNTTNGGYKFIRFLHPLFAAEWIECVINGKWKEPLMAIKARFGVVKPFNDVSTFKGFNINADRFLINLNISWYISPNALQSVLVMEENPDEIRLNH